MKPFLFLAKDFLNNVVTCVSAVLLIVAVSLLTNTKLNPIFLLIIILSNFTIYFFDFFDDKTDRQFSDKIEEKTVKKRRTFLIFSVAFLICLIFLLVFIFSNLASLIFFIFLMTLGVLYPLFFKKITRNIVGFKDLFVALIWNLMVVFYFVYFSVSINSGMLLLLVFIFIRDLLNASYCDLKDEEDDRKNGLLTFANYFGTKRFLKIFYLVNFLSIVILVYGYAKHILFPLSLFLILPVLLTSFFVFVADKKKNYSSLAVDLEYFVWVVVLMIANRM